MWLLQAGNKALLQEVGSPSPSQASLQSLTINNCVENKDNLAQQSLDYGNQDTSFTPYLEAYKKHTAFPVEQR